MTTKRVRLNENVHKKLLNLKKKSQARSINDVIETMLEAIDEDYITGTIQTENKYITLKYNSGKLVEIQVTKK
jgi:predicted CopG family antitoxin